MSYRASPLCWCCQVGVGFFFEVVPAGAFLAAGCGRRIIRIVLIRVTGLQQAHPAGQPRLHVQHPVARRDQLLGQQPAQPAGTLHRPGPLRPHRRPRDQLPGPGGAGAHPQLAQRLLRRADRRRRVRALVRVHADHHCRHQHPPGHPRGRGRTWRACLIPDLLGLAPLSSHATARPDRLAPRSKARPHAVGRRFGSQPVGPHERYGTPAAPSGSIR